jgi:hypothetical protein
MSGLWTKIGTGRVIRVATPEAEGLIEMDDAEQWPNPLPVGLFHFRSFAYGDHVAVYRTDEPGGYALGTA